MSKQATTDTPREPEVVRLRGADRFYTGIICSEGTRYLHLVVLGENVRLVNVDKREERHMQPLHLKGMPYPVKRAARIVLRMHRTFTGTDSAKAALRRLLA